MINNEKSVNSPTFSFYTNEELEQKDCIKQIDLILEKYNIDCIFIERNLSARNNRTKNMIISSTIEIINIEYTGKSNL